MMFRLMISHRLLISRNLTVVVETGVLDSKRGLMFCQLPLSRAIGNGLVALATSPVSRDPKKFEPVANGVRYIEDN